MSAVLDPIGGKSSWRGAELTAKSSWQRALNSAEIAALERAVISVDALGLLPPRQRREDFPVPELANLFSWMTEQLEDGPGFVRLTGVPVKGKSSPDLRRLFWGFCTNFGEPIFQTIGGEVISELTDETGTGAAVSYTENGQVRNATAVVRSTAPLRFHADSCDVLALFCTNNAMSGGESKLVSSVALHDEIAKRRPDLLRVLYEPFWFTLDRGAEAAVDSGFPLPVFSHGPDGRLNMQYSRAHITEAQRISSVPRLTPRQIEAMDLIASICDEICLVAPFQTGDMQFMNQHLTLHGRNGYKDDPETNASRVLLRIWMSTPFSRELPAAHAAKWGDTKGGAVRGGALPGRSAVQYG